MFCVFLLGGCGQNPESITNKDLKSAIKQYYKELDKDALDVFEVVGRDRTCEYFKEEIKKELTSSDYSVQIRSELVSGTIDNYQFIYDKYFTESNRKLEKLAELNEELGYYIQSKSDIVRKYPFSLAECVWDIQSKNMYVTNRIEYESYEEEGSYWSACNVVYNDWLGDLPGDDEYILYSTEMNPFTDAGAYEIYYYADGTTLMAEDCNGFQKEVPLLYMIDTNDYWNFTYADDSMYQLLILIGDVYGISLNSDGNIADMEENNVESGQATGFEYLGIWQDSYSQRCSIEISSKDNTYYSVLIQWSSGANESTEWVCEAEYDEVNKQLIYTGVCNNVIYNDDGSVQNDLIYDNGQGVIYIGSDGNLYWEDYVQDSGADCVFTKM